MVSGNRAVRSVEHGKQCARSADATWHGKGSGADMFMKVKHQRNTYEVTMVLMVSLLSVGEAMNQKRTLTRLTIEIKQK